jgi:hypothetical protein
MRTPYKMKMKSYGKGKNPIKFMGMGGAAMGAVRGIFGGKNKNQNPNAAAANAVAEAPQNPQNPNPQNPPVNQAQGTVGGAVNAMPR